MVLKCKIVLLINQLITTSLGIAINISLELAKNDVVTAESISFEWRLLAAIVSINLCVTLKRKNNHSTGTLYCKYSHILNYIKLYVYYAKQLTFKIADGGNFLFMQSLFI